MSHHKTPGQIIAETFWKWRNKQQQENNHENSEEPTEESNESNDSNNTITQYSIKYLVMLSQIFSITVVP